MQHPKDLRLGLDLGGTKIEAAVLDGQDTICARDRIAMPDRYDDALDAIRTLVRETEALAGTRLTSAGIGTPGAFLPEEGVLRNAANTPLNHQPLEADLTRILGGPVCIGNDANCFALAEARSGAGKGQPVVFGAILGTGIGGGVVVGGQPVPGRNRIGGEWGHTPLPVDGIEAGSVPRCSCGRLGCIEAWCSGPGLVADHFRRTGSELDPAMLAAFADAGDFEAKETLALHLSRLGRALAGVVNVLDPDVIVLGGGLSKMPHLYAGLPDAIRPHAFTEDFQTPIIQNQLGDSAGVIGAAWLCPVPLGGPVAHAIEP